MTVQGQTGRCESVSEVLRVGLRLFDEREAKVAALRVALDEAEQSAEPEPFDVDEFVREQGALDG